MDDVNKSKLQLRSGLSINGSDKSPSPSTRLLINHGKPNFTIPRSYKTQNGNANTTSSTHVGNFRNNNNSNEFIVKSTTFSGIFKPSNISAAAKQTLPQNGKTISRNGDNDNEAAKVVLRRPKIVHTDVRQQEREDDDNVPEFIRRQRRIQERLANQNILDFENRRSGYFTQVMISPSSPNRKSFVETMASPAVKPGLEMPAPATQHEDIKLAATSKEAQEGVEQTQQEQQQQTESENGENHGSLTLEPVTLNGQVEEEEVAKAIEEVNKAVEGEDDDKTELEYHYKDSQQETNEIEYAAAETALKNEEEFQPKKDETQPEDEVAAEISTSNPEIAGTSQQQTSQERGQDETTNVSVSIIANNVEESKSNGHTDVIHHETGITISHVNGINGPSIPAPDPSGEKGVNYETKTVVSFSQELGHGDNKYPDTVKVMKENGVSAADDELKELTKLKFEIKADNQGIEVKPVLVNETA